MGQPRVLISGASVAGPVLAYWLHRFGFRPTVVERTAELRAGGGGHAVDLFGPALDVMDWMGVGDQVERARTTTEVIALVRPGRPWVEVPAEMLSEGVSERHIEIMRGDLARIVFDATRNQVEYVFGDSITALQDEGGAVRATFEHAGPRHFDLVVGADGLHSITRRLIFGPEERFSRFLGGYLAVFTVPNHLALENRMIGLSVPGRTAWLYPVGDRTHARAGFLWRAPRLHDYDRHDLDAQRRLLHELYGDLGWEVPRLLAGLDRADDLYMDSITQIVMPTWTGGRVALVGDAGYCPGPAVGGGTSLAVIGAYLLASELVRAGGDPTDGFAAYQRALEPVVRHSRSIGPAAIDLVIPATRRRIWILAQAMRLLPRLPLVVRRRITTGGGSASAMLDEARLTPPDLLPRLTGLSGR
ncbi:FAD-dependent monooxygenase [Georgenia sp. SYP-B2076]|uniref:FAD-dependent monooxygenase n=1 Tax=Georgenia sp. SYP-B2076 TaxID=2495881 RepID=UPI000F8DAE33|nr:FAD-dependent monooxygenase [Georgenia sp. SYP-B2076]